MSKIIFSTLAMNQTVFFYNIAKELESKGYQIFFICFDEKSHSYLVKNKMCSFNVFKEIKNIDPEHSGIIDTYKIDNLELILNHEKAYYNETNVTKQTRKFERYLAAVTSIFESIGPKEATLVQEFGGFVSVAAGFYSARHCGINNFFIEPSFYKGRVIFQKNTYRAAQIEQSVGGKLNADLRELLDDIVKSKAVVIPDKDKKQYRSAITKILDLKNIFKFFQKLGFKYLLRKKQEFHYIWLHVWRHFNMVLNKYRIKDRYLGEIGKEKYIYFPLHVPNDASLTIRSPEYFDQIKLLNFLANILPEEYLLYIKEHPALTGVFDYKDMCGLLTNRTNVRLLNSSMNNYDVVDSSTMMITVNSKAGAEALLLSKPVIVLGDSFYRGSNDVIRNESLDQIEYQINEVINGEFKIDKDSVSTYFGDIWANSWDGELYLNESKNVRVFSNSLRSCIDTGGVM